MKSSKYGLKSRKRTSPNKNMQLAVKFVIVLLSIGLFIQIVLLAVILEKTFNGENFYQVHDMRFADKMSNQHANGLLPPKYQGKFNANLIANIQEDGREERSTETKPDIRISDAASSIDRNEGSEIAKHADKNTGLPNNRCSKAHKGEIILKGERHSGTNWIRRIIVENLLEGESKIEQESNNFGWKHGFLAPMGWGEPLSENEILVVVTRDAFTWLPKMFRQPYDPIMAEKAKDGFSSFLRASYSAECQPARSQCRKYHLQESPHETAENIIQIRTQKYKQWLSNALRNSNETTTYLGSNDSFVQNRVHLRLESLTIENDLSDNPVPARALQKKLIINQLKDRCVQFQENIKAVTSKTNRRWKPGDEEKMVFFSPNLEKQNLLKKYSKDDLRFVLSQLDLEFEKKIGYDYSSIYEILDEDASLTSNKQ